MKRTLWVTLVLGTLVAVASAFTKAGDPGWKNLKILPKNITEKQMDSVMEHYAKSLNVGCDFCHVKTVNNGAEEWDMASDKKKHKLKAREMMTMTNEINDKYFPYGGKADSLSTALTVTCYTCHNGHKEPLTTLAKAAPAFPPFTDTARRRQ